MVLFAANEREREKKTTLKKGDINFPFKILRPEDPGKEN